MFAISIYNYTIGKRTHSHFECRLLPKVIIFLKLLIAAVLGVLLAFRIQRKYDKSKDEKNIDKTKNNLINELKGIASSFSAMELVDGKIHFDTPVWKAIIATGSILELLGEGETSYDNLLEIYAMLFGLRKMEENFLENREEIVKLRREITDKITRYCNGHQSNNRAA